MKDKEKKMNLIMSGVISFAMGALAAFLTVRGNPEAVKATPVPMIYISNIVMSFLVGILIALFIPLGRLGRVLASKAKADPPSVKFFLINAVPVCVGNALIVSLAVSLAGIFLARAKAPAEAVASMPPFHIMWLMSWGRILFPTLILSYVLAVVLSPVVAKALGLIGPSAVKAPR